MVWLIHLVGDVHQPLHATSRFTNAVPKGDAGGNAIKLCLSPCRDELHAFWDQVVGRNETVSASIRAAHALPPPNAAKVTIADETVWIQESFEIARTVAYAAPIGTGTGPFTLDANYKSHARTVALGQIALAGARLAHLLNQELK